MIRLSLALVSLLCCSLASALPIDFQADNYVTSFETKKTEGSGHVHIEYQGQIMTADHVIIDNKDNTLHADGNVSVVKGILVIKAKRANLNLTTGYGIFYDATVRHGVSFYLEGREVNYYAENRYRSQQAKFSICQDCPQSWSVTGADMDAEVEGFVKIHHAVVQIKDIPIAYLPVLVVPAKSKRQSGFLFPRIASVPYAGFTIAQPYYQVISDSADTTFDYLYTTSAGHRFDNEFRLYDSNRTFIEAFESYQPQVKPQGWGIDAKTQLPTKSPGYGGEIIERWQLSPHWVQRFRSEFESDPLYSGHLFPGEFPVSYRLPSLETEASLSWQSKETFLYGLPRLEEDNLIRDPQKVYAQSHGLGQIENLPEVGLSETSFDIVGPIRGNVDTSFNDFYRGGSSIDPQTGWIRTGERSTVVMRVSAPQNVFGSFQWKPSIEGRGDFYAFQAPGVAPSAYRMRYLVDQTFGTELSHVWYTDGTRGLKAFKNIIEPYVRWTYADYDHTSNHPFFNQGRSTANTVGAPQFDLFDPNGDARVSPFNTGSEELRLRANDLITLGFDSRFIGRFGELSRTYSTLFEVKVTQDFDVMNRNNYNVPTPGVLLVSLLGDYAGFHINSAFGYDFRSHLGYSNNEISYSWARYLLGFSEEFTPQQAPPEGPQPIPTANFYGFNGEIREIGPWTVSGAYGFNHLGGFNQVISRLAYGGGTARCFYVNLNYNKLYGQNSFGFYPEFGFIFSESGQKASMTSLAGSGRAAH